MNSSLTACWWRIRWPAEAASAIRPTTVALVAQDKSTTTMRLRRPQLDRLSQEEKQARPGTEPYSVDGDIQPIWPVPKSPDQDCVGPLFVDRNCRHDTLHSREIYKFNQGLFMRPIPDRRSMGREDCPCGVGALAGSRTEKSVSLPLTGNASSYKIQRSQSIITQHP